MSSGNGGSSYGNGGTVVTRNTIPTIIVFKASVAYGSDDYVSMQRAFVNFGLLELHT